MLRNGSPQSNLGSGAKQERVLQPILAPNTTSRELLLLLDPPPNSARDITTSASYRNLLSSHAKNPRKRPIERAGVLRIH